MKYKDLDLKKIREEMDLDFAHFTYKKGMCSCCYCPTDLPRIYWRDRTIKEKEYTYLLFKNADNGSGTVKKEDEICHNSYSTFVEWDFPIEKLDGVCNMLREQLGEEYEVIKPKNDMYCIEIRKNNL